MLRQKSQIILSFVALSLLRIDAALSQDSRSTSTAESSAVAVADRLAERPFWDQNQQRYQLAESSISDLVLPTGELLAIGNAAGTNRPPVANQSGNAESPVRVAVNQEIPAANQSVEIESRPQPPRQPATEPAENSLPLASNPPKVNEKPEASSATSRSSIDDFRQRIDSQQQAINADTQINDAVKASRLKILASATEALVKLEEFESKTQKFRDQIESIGNSERSIELQLEQSVEPATPQVTPTTKSETLLSNLKRMRDELQEKKAERKELEKEIKFHSDRVTQIPADRADALERLSALTAEIEGAEPADTDGQLVLLLQNIRQQAVQAELEKLDVEVQRQELGARVDPLKRDLVAREIKRLQAEIRSWEEASKQLRSKEVAAQTRQAKDEAARAHWSLKPLAERNAELVERRNLIAQNMQKLKKELATISQNTDSIAKRRAEIDSKIEAAGLTSTSGMLLVDLRRNLMTTGESHLRIRSLQAELRSVNLAKVGLREERDELSDPLAAAKKLTGIDETDSELSRNAIEFVETKRNYLDQLLDDHDAYGRLVSEVLEQRKSLVESINEALAWIDENALWIRSSDPISIAMIPQARNGLAAFTDGDRWTRVFWTAGTGISQRPVETVFSVLAIFGLSLINRKVRSGFSSAEESDEQST